jgi:hypothetical protein
MYVLYVGKRRERGYAISRRIGAAEIVNYVETEYGQWERTTQETQIGVFDGDYLFPRGRSSGSGMFNQKMPHADFLRRRIRSKILSKVILQGIRVSPIGRFPSRFTGLQIEIIRHVLRFRNADFPLWGKTRGLIVR